MQDSERLWKVNEFAFEEVVPDHERRLVLGKSPYAPGSSIIPREEGDVRALTVAGSTRSLPTSCPLLSPSTSSAPCSSMRTSPSVPNWTSWGGSGRRWDPGSGRLTLTEISILHAWAWETRRDEVDKTSSGCDGGQDETNPTRRVASRSYCVTRYGNALCHVSLGRYFGFNRRRPARLQVARRICRSTCRV